MKVGIKQYFKKKTLICIICIFYPTIECGHIKELSLCIYKKLLKLIQKYALRSDEISPTYIKWSSYFNILWVETICTTLGECRLISIRCQTECVECKSVTIPCCSRVMSIFTYWLRTGGPTDWLTHVSVYEMGWLFRCRIEWFNLVVLFHKMVEFLLRNLRFNYKGACSMDTDKVLQSFS